MFHEGKQCRIFGVSRIAGIKMGDLRDLIALCRRGQEGRGGTFDTGNG